MRNKFGQIFAVIRGSKRHMGSWVLPYTNGPSQSQPSPSRATALPIRTMAHDIPLALIPLSLPLFPILTATPF
ncbi:Uncharacterized protein TCM_016162 [Theobroma cacao]|uniref:Uncharacterized protein n=1 Tax=Theobroma cacao TaxID=3641 RepID=A0A061G4V2_THECC|nr:Uncharacterized protein TCM_016162 [Theobroma cacao]